MIPEIILYSIVIFLGYFLYKYRKNHLYFENRGLKFCKGIPIFGNLYSSSLGLQHFVDDMDDVYRKFPDEKYVGFVEGTRRIILLRDPDLIKLVLVKDFNYFVNRKVFFPDTLDPLLGNSIVSMKGDNWREMRGKLTSSFTSSKIKNMMPLMMKVADNIVNFIKDNQSKSLDAVDLMRRYSSDVIASTAFGIQVDSVKDINNDFYKTGLETVDFNLKKILCLFFASEWPSSVKIMKMLGIYITTPKNANFFRNVVTNTIENRKKNNIVRPDFIHLLLEASKDWTTDEIVGQAYIAFIAGFESVASTLTMCIHLLALHPDVQEKLYQEIKVNEEDGFTYETINQFKYLDCVLNETERLWSTAVVIDRMCSKTYDLPSPRDDGKPYRVYPGDVIYVPPNSIHLDEKYFPSPKSFKPERFSDENKHKIKPFSFLPFGGGPRGCIGKRFSILELKIIIYEIMRNFKIEKCEKTVENIILEPGVFSVKVQGGSWVRFTSRMED